MLELQRRRKPSRKIDAIAVELQPEVKAALDQWLEQRVPLTRRAEAIHIIVADYLAVHGYLQKK